MADLSAIIEYLRAVMLDCTRSPEDRDFAAREISRIYRRHFEQKDKPNAS